MGNETVRIIMFKNKNVRIRTLLSDLGDNMRCLMGSVRSLHHLHTRWLTAQPYIRIHPGEQWKTALGGRADSKDPEAVLVSARLPGRRKEGKVIYLVNFFFFPFLFFRGLLNSTLCV